MKEEFEVVSSDRFVAHYMRATNASLDIQKSPIQVYPLNQTSHLIATPTPLFRAEYNFLLMFSAGGGIQQVDNELIELQTNDVLFIREGHLNAIQSIQDDSQGYFIYMDNALLPDLFPDKSLLNQFTFQPKRSVSERTMHWLCDCTHLLYQLKEMPLAKLETERALIKAMILHLSTTYEANQSLPDRSTEITFLFKELLYANFRKNREVTFYANRLSITENYLHRCVKKVTGKPPKQHMNEVAIFHSQLLLQNQSKDIAEVAFELHFSDPAYFTRLFKQITGLTPSDYRASIWQDLSK